MDKQVLRNVARALAASMPEEPKVAEVSDKVLEYADKFGYLEGIHWGDVEALAQVRDRIVKIQSVLGIEEDGVPGSQTLKAIETVPRCANRDYLFAREAINRWAREQADSLTWCIRDYLSGMQSEVQDQIMDGAWKAWEAVCNLTLIPVRDPRQANIVISCSADARDELGTPGNVLAWAELPQGANHNRQLLSKFDLAERWALEPNQQGILLFNVACHEFGHLLGLDHTMIRGELMYPTYARNISLPQQRYDIPQVRERYGSRTTPPSPPPTGTNPFREWVLRHTVTGQEFRIGI